MYFDREVQGFVGEIGHHETKRLFRQVASTVVQTSYAWRSDSTITFHRFGNGITISYRNAVSEIYSEFVDVEGYEVRVSLYFVK